MEHRNRISLRLPNWDYSWAGVYFITTCTKDRNCYFGNVVHNSTCFAYRKFEAGYLYKKDSARSCTIFFI